MKVSDIMRVGDKIRAGYLGSSDIPYFFPTSGSLPESLRAYKDADIFEVTEVRDNSIIADGIEMAPTPSGFRQFERFSNVVLKDALERVHIGDLVKVVSMRERRNTGLGVRTYITNMTGLSNFIIPASVPLDQLPEDMYLNYDSAVSIRNFECSQYPIVLHSNSVGFVKEIWDDLVTRFGPSPVFNLWEYMTIGSEVQMKVMNLRRGTLYGTADMAVALPIGYRIRESDRVTWEIFDRGSTRFIVTQIRNSEQGKIHVRNNAGYDYTAIVLPEHWINNKLNHEWPEGTFERQVCDKYGISLPPLTDNEFAFNISRGSTASRITVESPYLDTSYISTRPTLQRRDDAYLMNIPGASSVRFEGTGGRIARGYIPTIAYSIYFERLIRETEEIETQLRRYIFLKRAHLAKHYYCDHHIPLEFGGEQRAV